MPKEYTDKEEAKNRNGEAATTDWIKQNGFLARVHRGYESSYTPSLGIICSNSFCESLLQGLLLLRVRTSESSFFCVCALLQEEAVGRRHESVSQ